QKFLELRARAQHELGSRFDVRAFHDEVLGGGALPLDVLDQRTSAWIAAQKHARASVVAEPRPAVTEPRP
ncbi:MAG TPA: DUF885 family protein, partial [Bryobacteraceae bacterium]|nr:DUF885 family protein [Bryobacteraceae bacterium]